MSIKYPVSQLRIAKQNFQQDINELESIASDLKAAGNVESVELVDALDGATQTDGENFRVEIQLAEQAASAAS